MKLGWIGLGNMGTPIVKNLLKAGFEVAVFNRTKEKEQAVIEAGATSANSAGQLINDCDIVFTMVSDDNAVKAIFDGGSGLLANAQAGKLIIDMSTVSPETSTYLAEACQQKQVDFLEAPVSGSVKPAQDGTLIILVGGSAEAYQKAKPMFDVIGKLSLHLGDNGVGSAAKLAINYLLALVLQGMSETVLFAEKNGVKKEDMLTIINEGAIGNAIMKLKTPSILANNFPPAFALKLMAKDLRLAKAAGMDLPLSTPLFNSYNEALNNGLGDEDVMAIFKYLGKE
jgi:3-hydroxyisobutyrate dehydrogenase